MRDGNALKDYGMNIIMGGNMPSKEGLNKTPMKGQKGYAGIDIHETYQQN